MTKVRRIAGWLLLAATVLFAASLLLPCQKVNVRLGWSLGLEAAPIFEQVSVFEAVAEPTALRIVAGLILSIVAAIPFTNLAIASLAKAPALAYMAHYAWLFGLTGGIAWGRADRVLYGYYVHRSVSCVVVLLAAAALLYDGVTFLMNLRTRPSDTSGDAG